MPMEDLLKTLPSDMLARISGKENRGSFVKGDVEDSDSERSDRYYFLL